MPDHWHHPDSGHVIWILMTLWKNQKPDQQSSLGPMPNLELNLILVLPSSGFVMKVALPLFSFFVFTNQHLAIMLTDTQTTEQLHFIQVRKYHPRNTI
jgi:hypothetical protein